MVVVVQRPEVGTAPPTEEGEVSIEQKRLAITLLLEPIRDLHPHYSLAVTDANGRVVARSAPEGASLPSTTLYHIPGVPHALQGESPPPAIVYQTDGLENTCALAMSLAIPIVGAERRLLGAVYVAYSRSTKALPSKSKTTLAWIRVSIAWIGSPPQPSRACSRR